MKKHFSEALARAAAKLLDMPADDFASAISEARASPFAEGMERLLSFGAELSGGQQDTLALRPASVLGDAPSLRSHPARDVYTTVDLLETVSRDSVATRAANQSPYSLAA